VVRRAGPGQGVRAAARDPCTQCAARRDITDDEVLPGIRIAGAPTFVEEVMTEGAQALVY
jgi:predicted peroxiredoxin